MFVIIVPEQSQEAIFSPLTNNFSMIPVSRVPWLASTPLLFDCDPEPYELLELPEAALPDEPPPDPPTLLPLPPLPPDMFIMELALNTPIDPVVLDPPRTLIVSLPPKTELWLWGVPMEAESSVNVPIGGNEFDGVNGGREDEGGLP